MPLLEIQDLKIEFAAGGASWPALDGVSLSIEAGETLCLVGESGSGKSITALSIARLLPSPPARYVGGRILLEGRDVLGMSAAELRRIRGGVVGYVLQDPAASLNPVLRVGNQLKETLRIHRPDAATDREVIRLLSRVGIPTPEGRFRSYPHELSGGLQQRVMIAMALASHPKLLVADEPTSALDVTIQAQILDLLTQLRRESGMAILLITHNLAIAGELADRVAVMYAGQIVENGPAGNLLRNPFHPYTQALVQANPEIGARAERLPAIPGSPPQPGGFPAGCRFHPRCPQAQPSCSRDRFALLEREPGHWVRCPFSAGVPTGPSDGIKAQNP